MKDLLPVLLVVLSMLVNQCKPFVEKSGEVAHDTTAAIHTITCLSDTAQSYCIALPSCFTVGTRYPVVFVFDPHGNGNLAVNTFREGASEFGFIIAGSNVIRNGYDRIEYALQTLTNDVTSRYPVDAKRVYAAGFSGGGRVAQIFSQTNSIIKSIAVMGAGFSPDQRELLSDKASMLFITGNEDFNYLEIMNSQKALSTAGIHHFILEYPGKHEWPACEIIHDALQWFEFDAYRRDPSLKQKSVVNMYLTTIQQQETLLEENHDLSGAAQCIEKGIAFLSEITRTKSLEKKLRTIKESPGYRQVLKQKQDAIALEMRLQQGYVTALMEKDTLWWKNEIHGLNEKISHSDNAYLQPVYMRIKSFISIAAFSYCNGAISQHSLSGAERYVSIYQIVDPGNPDGYYFQALLIANKGKNKAAIQYFKKAVETGFSDFKKARQELPEEVFLGGYKP